MKLSIFDNNFNNPETEKMSFEERSEFFRNLGFTAVHWFYPDPNNEYLELFKPNGFAASSMNVLARITSADDIVFNEAVKEIFDSLKFCSEIGCKDAMIVPCYTEDINGAEDRPRARQRMIEGLKLAVEEAKKYDIRVSIENFSDPFLTFSLIEDIRYILDSVDGLWFTFDTGNFVCAGEDGVKAYKTLKDRIVMMHLKEFGEVSGPGDRVIQRNDKYLYGVKFGTGFAQLDVILPMAARDFPDIWYEIEHHNFQLGCKDVEEIVDYVKKFFK